MAPLSTYVCVAVTILQGTAVAAFAPYTAENNFSNNVRRPSTQHHPFIPPFDWTSSFSTTTRLFLNADDDDGDDDDDVGDEDDFDLSEQDWRTFRAKLVQGESRTPTSATAKESSEENDDEDDDDDDIKSAVIEDDGDLDGIGAVFSEEQASLMASSGASITEEAAKLQENMTPLDPSQWAYDSGKVIEQGAVILGGVEQDYGFGLRQQYFHKAAILVLDHQESTFTKGIILNRPSDLTLDDDVNKGVKWRVWFGGDVQGLTSDNPDIVCLHTIKKKVVTRASVSVMKDIQWTTFEAAKQMVRDGHAKPTDFWVFCGYAGWGPGQLMRELERKSWYMVATDSQTLLKELARQGAGADPRDAGLETWTLLMNMIGRSETAEEHTGDFDDLMLKEWALKNLLSAGAGGGAAAGRKGEGKGGNLESLTRELQDLVKRVSKGGSRNQQVTEGTIVRASPVERSPFLLDDQELHKSIILIISDDDQTTVGVILNRPGAKGLEVRIQEKDSGDARQLKVPLRYGGPYSVKGNEPLLWLHCSSALKEAKIGSPVGGNNGIWKCTANDLITAVGQALATPEDFLVVAGVSVWTKGVDEATTGMQGEIRSGRFEVVPEWKTQAIWDELAKQEVLSDKNLAKNLLIADEAWNKGSVNGKQEKKNGDSKTVPLGGLGEGFDEDDDSLVFKSDVKVSKLSDDALRNWVATFLLGAPSLGS